MSPSESTVSELYLQLMKEMGFTYDPSTAGSSVRFDPPCKGDPVRIIQL